MTFNGLMVRKYLGKGNEPWWKFLIFGLILCAWMFFYYKKALNGGDFDVYLGAAQKLTTGDNIYAPPFVKGLQYYYSVAFALFLSAFIKIPTISKFIWLLFSTWCIYRSWLIALFFIAPEKWLSHKSLTIWQYLVFFIALRFALYNFLTLQLTLFLLWVCLESIYQSYNNRPYLGGILLGIAVNIKLLPLVIIPYLIYRAYYKTAITSLLVIILLFLLPALFIGIETNFFLLAEWWNIINPLSSENSIKTDKLMHCLSALVPAYFMDSVDGFGGARNIVNFSENTVKLIINILRFVLISGSLFFLKWPPFGKATSKEQIWWEVSYILLIVPLVFPHQQKYAFWFILPSISYIALALLVKKTKYQHFLMYVFVLLWLLISPLVGRDILGSYIYDLFQYYKVLSLVSFCLIVWLAILSPKKIFYKMEHAS